MKAQMRKITKMGNYQKVSCPKRNIGLGIHYAVNVKKCRKCENFLKKRKHFIYCKIITAPPWMEDKVKIIDA